MTTARRFGRMTAAQERVMLTASEHKNLITIGDLSAWLALSGSKIVEVGFGMGDSLHKMSQYHADEQYLGIDVYKPGVAALLKKINDTTIGNLNVMYHDAIDVLTRFGTGLMLGRWRFFHSRQQRAASHHDLTLRATNQGRRARSSLDTENIQTNRDPIVAVIQL